MKVKQLRWLPLSLALLVVVALVACAAPAPSPAATSQAKGPVPAPAPTTPAASPAGEDWKKEPIKDHVVSWAQQGGVSQTMCAGISDVVNRHSNMKLELTVIPNSKLAAASMAKGESDFFYYTTPSTFDIYLGRGGVEQKVKVRTLMMGDETTLSVRGIWVRADSSIKAETDIRGKKIGYQPGQTWSNGIVEAMAKANGIPLSEVKLTPISGGTEAGSMLTEKTLDGFVFVGGAATVELQRTIGLRMVPMSQKAFDVFVQSSPGFSYGISPKGWEGTLEDTPTAVTWGGVWMRDGVNDITAYTMMKTLFENISEFNQISEKAKGYKLATASKRFDSTPYHPGVIRYYKEKGVWGDKEEQENQKLLAKEKEIYSK